MKKGVKINNKLKNIIYYYLDYFLFDFLNYFLFYFLNYFLFYYIKYYLQFEYKKLCFSIYYHSDLLMLNHLKLMREHLQAA